MILKKNKEDFLVEEIIDENIISETPTNNHIYILEKKNYTTERAVQHIAKALHIPRKFVNYAGAKDKNAITKQHITISKASKERVEQLELKDIKLQFYGYAKQQLKLGSLKGNKFTITIRELDENEIIKKEKRKTLPKTFIVPNYFDEQRFSTNNVPLGIAILQKNYEKAVELLSNDRDAETVHDWLKTHTNDYVGALQRLPKKVLLFFVHAVQSKLFNDTIGKKVELLCKKTNKEIKKIKYSQGEFIFPKQPLPLDFAEEQELLKNEDVLLGYESEPTKEEEQLLEENEITINDFINKQLPSLSVRGGQRKTFFKVENLEIEEAEEDEEKTKEEKEKTEKDDYLETNRNETNNKSENKQTEFKTDNETNNKEINNEETENQSKNKKQYKQKISFTLGKGSYATIVVKQLYE